MKEVCIQGLGGHINIFVLSYERPYAKDISDANWLNCRVSVTVHPFSGAYNASFSTHDFLRFGDAIKILSDSLSGEAAFETDEGALRLRLIMQARGELSIEGEAAVSTASQIKLQFKLQADQSFLGELHNSVIEVLSVFPVRSGN